MIAEKYRESLLAPRQTGVPRRPPWRQARISHPQDGGSGLPAPGGGIRCNPDILSTKTCPLRPLAGPRQGLALMVVVLVVLLAGIAASHALPGARGEMLGRKRTGQRDAVRELEAAARRFAAWNHRPPVSVGELLGDQAGRRFLRRVPIDPFSGRADWQIVIDEAGQADFLPPQMGPRNRQATELQNP
jgi:hypothetical protein